MIKYFLFLLLTHVSITIAIYPRISTLKIYSDSPLVYKAGYNNCDPSSNGEYNLIQHVIKSGDILFDVGANVGNWTRYIVTINPHVHIHAFEPMPKIFEILQQNFNTSNVILHNLAIGKDIGLKDFYIYAGNPGLVECSSLYLRPVLAHVLGQKINVKITNLDTFCDEHQINHIDFLKIDTEGAEKEVLLGAQRLLKEKAITLIQFEYGGTYIDAHITLQQIYEILTSNDYSLFRIISGGLIQINDWHSGLETYDYANYVAVVNS